MVPFTLLPRVFQRALLALAALLAVVMVACTAAIAQDAPTLVIALDKLDGDKVYARTVMFATPTGNGGHFGLILNRPTQHTMARVFPDHPPSAAVKENLYMGGPDFANVVFALARAKESPGAGSREIAPGLWLIIQADTIDAFIERTPNDARYFMGIVRWRPDELRDEVKGGAVMLRPLDVSRLFVPDTSKLYDELVTPNRKPAISL